MKKITILKGGTIVTDKTEYISDVKIEDGKISDIGIFGDIVGAEVVDTSGSLLFPGLVDAHTHLDMGEGVGRTADDFITGSKAAIAGGTTTLIDFATQSKGGTLAKALCQWQQKAAGKAFCDFGFHMAIVDWNDYIKSEMADMVEQGVPSFKMYMAYKDTLQVDDDVIYSALKQAKEIGGLLGMHCENGDIIVARTKELLAEGKTGPYYHKVSRPPEVEAEAINRFAQIAKLSGAPMWVVHLSTKEGLEVIKSMRAKGVDIVTESCPQYMVLDESVYGSPEDTTFEAAKYVISPPLRSEENVAAMWQGVISKDIDFISTDHCPYNYKIQKELGIGDFSKIPNGGPGIEHRLGLLYTFGVKENKISLSDMVRITSTKPAQLMGLASKGAIEVGKDADIVVFDPKASQTITASSQVQNLDYTPYEGMEFSGKVKQVFLRGERVYKDGNFSSKATGEFVPREKYVSKK